jgi:hypothetical protein
VGWLACSAADAAKRVLPQALQNLASSAHFVPQAEQKGIADLFEKGKTRLSIL